MVTRRKEGVPGLLATVMIVVLAACSSPGNDAQPERSGPTATPDQTSTPTPVPSSGALEPGTYAFGTLDPDFDASYRITMEVPDGYEGFEGWGVFQPGKGQGISAWVVGNVYADPCHWIGTLPDPPVGSSVDGLVAALASQKEHPASKPTEVTVGGFTGKQLETTVPRGIDLADCDNGQFRAWVDTTFQGARWLQPGQRDLLWIIDVSGVPLVIDVALGRRTSPQDRAERLQIVESIRIEPL